MKKIKCLCVFLTVVLAGCTDTVDTISREYRNTINESVDAMMMVTSEARAAAMTKRVFKGLSDRFQALDKKLQILRVNRVQKELVHEVLESDGAHMYFTELEVNRERFNLEMTRLRNLMNQLRDRKRELLIANGEPDPDIESARVAPALYGLLDGGVLDPLKSQLKSPGLVTMMDQFRSWKVDDLDKAFGEFMKKRKVFGLKRDIQLVQ